MIRFLETLGLRMESQPGAAGVAILRGRSGKVAGHPAAHSATGAPAGETHLSFEVDHMQTASGALRIHARRGERRVLAGAARRQAGRCHRSALRRGGATATGRVSGRPDRAAADG